MSPPASFLDNQMNVHSQTNLSLAEDVGTPMLNSSDIELVPSSSFDFEGCSPHSLSMSSSPLEADFLNTLGNYPVDPLFDDELELIPTEQVQYQKLVY